MRQLLLGIILGVSVATNVTLFYRDAPNTPLAGIGAPRAELSERSFPAAYRNEVIEMMKTNRLLNTLAVLAVLGFSGGAVAQTVSDDISKIVESVVIDNLKTTAGASATGLAVSSQAQASAQSILFQNAVAHASRVNAITERSLGQVMIVGPTEGAQGIKTVNEAGTTRDIGQMLGLLNALIAGQKQNAQVVALPTTP